MVWGWLLRFCLSPSHHHACCQCFSPAVRYVPIHCQTQSHDLFSCQGNSVEWTEEIVHRIHESLPSRMTESDSVSGPLRLFPSRSSWLLFRSRSSWLCSFKVKLASFVQGQVGFVRSRSSWLRSFKVELASVVQGQVGFVRPRSSWLRSFKVKLASVVHGRVGSVRSRSSWLGSFKVELASWK